MHNGYLDSEGYNTVVTADGSVSWSHPIESWLAAQLPTDAPDGGQLSGLPAARKLTRPVVDPESRILALGVSDTLAGYEIVR